MKFAKEEAMTPLVTLCGANQEDETQRRKQDMVKRLKLETADHWILDAGHQLDDRSLETCGPKIHEGDSPRPQCA